MILEPEDRAVHWLLRNGDSYVSAVGSTLIDLSVSRLENELEWD